MADIQRFDILVLGSGESGKYLAWTLAKAGRRAAVVERAWVGGSCPNIACLPSKNVIHSAQVAALVHRGAEFGITSRPVSVDMEGVRRRKRRMVDALTVRQRPCSGWRDLHRCVTRAGHSWRRCSAARSASSGRRSPHCHVTGDACAAPCVP